MSVLLLVNKDFLYIPGVFIKLLLVYLLSRNYWLQPEESNWHSDVPAGISSETDGQN